MNTPEKNTARHGATIDYPVFDADVLGAMFGTESAVIASVLQTFVAGTQSNLNELALASHDLARVATLAHKVTGASRMSGAHALGHCARNLEQAAKRDDAAAVRQGLLDLETQWHLLKTAIDTHATQAR